MYCHQTCDDSYTIDGLKYLNLTCIDCDNIPQMSDISVMWQVGPLLSVCLILETASRLPSSQSLPLQQAFQFSLVGASEILAAITSLEFFYSQAPISMRSVSQSLNLFTNALGSFLVIPVLLLVNSDSSKTSLLVAGVVVTILTLPYYSLTRTGNEWVPTNLDEGHLDYYFFLLAGLMGLTLVRCFPLLLSSAPAANMLCHFCFAADGVLLRGEGLRVQDAGGAVRVRRGRAAGPAQRGGRRR
jgi:hypothetical protein